jgi:hypothetical protein
LVRIISDKEQQDSDVIIELASRYKLYCYIQTAEF